MKIHLLSGFLGSGKTTAIRTAAGVLMRSGVKTGVITNDQGIRLVDGGFLHAAGIPGRQVMNGCFCCNYSDLDRQIESMTVIEQPEVIFAESVGSCTDIVATVLKPLCRYRPESATTLSVVCDGLLLKMLLLEAQTLFGPEVEYIYWKQIEEASLLLLNKTDLLATDEIRKLEIAIGRRFGPKRILPLLATSEKSVTAWLTELSQSEATPGLSPDVNYDLYAAGEAMMGWLDMDILVKSDRSDAGSVARELIATIGSRIRTWEYPVGHIKWLIDDREKISLTATDSRFHFPELPAATQVKLLLNARVQTLPAKLTDIVNGSMTSVAADTGAQISAASHSAFQPGYPRPEHRMA